MTTVHDTYSYQRFIKTEEYPPPAQSEPLTSDEQPPPSNPGAINRLTSQQRNQLLLKATRAERALRLQQTTERHHPEIKQSALVWNNLGIRQLESGDMPRAFRNFQEAIAQDPSPRLRGQLRVALQSFGSHGFSPAPAGSASETSLGDTPTRV